MASDTQDHSELPELVAAAHSLAADEVAARLQVQPQAGLGLDEVKTRRKRYGANRLPDAPPRSAWLVFFSQFKSILILILLGAASLPR